jgi:predicted DNA-binding protein with PD1-like motif
MRVHAVRLTPGTDLRAELERLTEALGLRAGCILSCAGGLSHARLRMPGAAGEAEVFMTWVEPMEILSLTGTLCPDGPHVHISLSRRDGSCVGGHLVRGCVVNTTAELVIGEAPEVEFHRPLDPATGYNELSVQPRRSRGEPPAT